MIFFNNLFLKRNNYMNKLPKVKKNKLILETYSDSIKIKLVPTWEFLKTIAQKFESAM